MRAFSRILPAARSVARSNFQRSAKAPLTTNAFNLFVPALQQYGVRAMSTEAQRHLADVLDEQIKEEKMNSVEFEEVEQSAVPEGWRMENKDDESGEVIMKKTVGNENITLTVNAYDLESEEPNEDPEEQEEAFGGAEDEDELDSGNYGVHVAIELVKGDGPTLTCEAVAWSRAGFELTALHTSNDTDYPGPKLNDLDETLSEAIHEYLAERGVDEDLAAFVAGHGWRKEHLAYKRWLQTVCDHVSK